MISALAASASGERKSRSWAGETEGAAGLLAAGAEPETLLKALVMGDVVLSRFEVVEPSLQSIFIAKVGQEAATPVARAEVA